MTLKEFTKGIEFIQEFDSLIYHLEGFINVELSESKLVNTTYELFNLFMGEYFTENGLDTILWWLYDSCPKIIYFEEDTLFGEEKHELELNTIEDLWNYLNSDKTYLKNGSTNS